MEKKLGNSNEFGWNIMTSSAADWTNVSSWPPCPYSNLGMALGDLGSGFGSGAASTRFLRQGAYTMDDTTYTHSLNNNFSFDVATPSTSAHCHPNVRGGTEDDEGSSILSNLPTSCDEFEIKEIEIKMERSLGSPMVSPCTSAAASGCPSAEPPVDEEDLEVQMINETFEEQQKQQKMYSSGDLKSLFYQTSVGSQDEGESLQGSSHSLARERRTNSKDSERLPFTKNLRKSAEDDNVQPTFDIDDSPVPSTAFPNTELVHSLFNSEAPFPAPRYSLGAPLTKTSAKDHNSKRRISEPFGVTHDPWQLSPGVVGKTKERSADTRHISFDSTIMSINDILSDSPSPSLLEEAPDTEFGVHSPMQGELASTLTMASSPPPLISRPQNLCDQTECLATEVVESLFTPQAKPPAIVEEKRPEAERTGPTVRKCSRRLDMTCVQSRSGSSESPRPNADSAHSQPPVPKDVWKMSDTELREATRLSEASVSSGTSTSSKADAATATEDVERDADSRGEDWWETVDDDTLNEQLEKLKLEAERRMAGKARAQAALPKPSEKGIPGKKVPEKKSKWNDEFLPHVLEVYDIPQKFTVKDIKTALVAKGINAEIKISGGNCALMVFKSVEQATQVVSIFDHPWLKLRRLALANPESQAAAKRLEPELLRVPKERPKTHTGTARRLIENSLGVRPTVSKEKRDEERKQLQTAREAKQFANAIWE